MGNIRWGEIKTEDFVRLYLQKECLWNRDHKDHKSFAKRQMAYEEILEDMKKTVEDVDINDIKMKIKNVRSTYCQEVKKILTKSKNPDQMYKPSLKWFHEMDERFSNTNSRKSIPYYEVSSDDYKEDNVNMNFEQNEVNTVSIVNQSEDDYEEIEVKVDQFPNRRISKMFKQKPTKHAKNSNSKSNEDEFDFYGKYVSSQLRKMSLNRALLVQIEIQKLLTNARLMDAA